MASDRTPKQRNGAPRLRVNSHDVARLAGVSASAVSRAFTPGASVAPAKKAAILKAARELGYRPSVMARAMVKGRSSVIGLVLFGETNRHHPEVLLALTRAFEARALRAMLFIVEQDEEVETVVEHILSYRLDGVVAAASIPDKDVLKLDKAGVPVIFYNRPGTSHCSSVSCDHETAGRMVARHLLAQGCKRFALIDARDSFVGAERMHGVDAELARADAAVIVRGAGDFAYDDGHRAMTDWLKGPTADFDAVIGANDLMTIGARDAFVGSGRSVEDVRFAGFDGVDAARWPSHPITTLSQPIEAMARATADMMSHQIGGENSATERRLFQGTLIADDA